MFVVLIAPGIYDEDLTIDDGGQKRIALIGLGPVHLGLMSGSSWTPTGGDTARSITWNVIGNGGIQPDGMQLTRFLGTFTAPAGQSLRLDSYTNWWFDPYEGGTATVSAGVEKLLIFSSRL